MPVIGQNQYAVIGQYCLSDTLKIPINWYKNKWIQFHGVKLNIVF